MFAEHKEQAATCFSRMSMILKLNTFLLTEYKSGKPYYSFTIPHYDVAMAACVDEHEEINRLANEAKRKYGVTVYHVLVSPYAYTMLCVSSEESTHSPLEITTGVARAYAAVYTNGLWEFGFVGVGSINGCPVRVF